MRPAARRLRRIAWSLLWVVALAALLAWAWGRPFMASARMLWDISRATSPSELPVPVQGVRARQIADISHLPYAAFVSGELIVTTKRNAASSRGIARKTISYRGSMSAVNGFNCTQGRSGYATPCQTRKAGLARVQRDVEDRKGRDVPLFVNLVSRSFPKLSGSGGGDAAIVRGGFLEVRRLKR